ncbi:MAG: hypothetical protein SFY32_07750 [Bacteroidota bacterium]|nr:hypothetical protein [Bacteroidota bacterium]
MKYVFVLLLIVGCNLQNTPKNFKKANLDIVDIIKFNENSWIKTKPVFVKKSYLNGITDSSVAKPTDYHKEFTLFESLDLNTPNMRDGYVWGSFRKLDTIYVNYVRKKDTRSDVSVIRAKFDTNNRLIQIEAKMNRNNLVFSRAKKLQLNFNPTISNPTISSLQISGSQGFVFTKRDTFALTSKVVY